MNQTKIESTKLNQLRKDLNDLNSQYSSFMKQAERNLYSAFETRWKYGKKISENYDSIVDEFGTQKSFANWIGDSEAVISNNKRAYENLLEQGCNTWDKVKNTLNQKKISPTIRNFEKIGTLLNEPDSKTTQKDQIPKDRKRLEELMQEVQDIIKRNEPSNNPEIAADAREFLEDIETARDYLESFHPKKSKFKSEKYLNFIRNFGIDVITEEPCEVCDPHHADPDGGTGSTGDTLPDYYALPVSRRTHTLLHYGLLQVTKEEILEAQFRVMSAFINKVL